MKIVSPFNDFYDSALAHGHSSEHLYLRQSSNFAEHTADGNHEIETRLFMFDGLPQGHSLRTQTKGELVLSGFRVAFCGKLYNGVRASVWAQSPYGLRKEERYEYFYSAKALEEFFLKKGASPANASKSASSRRSSLVTFLDTEPSSCLDFALSNREISAVAMGLHGNRKLVINPQLKMIDFFKVLDPWQAFQELEMFFGTLTAPENQPPVIISDKDRIAQHGFDRYSFRKAPTKRKVA